MRHLIQGFWVIDPATGKPSVPLTMFLIACTLMCVFIVLECKGMVKSTSLLDEFFGAMSMLYGGSHLTASRTKDSLEGSGVPSVNATPPSV